MFHCNTRIKSFTVLLNNLTHKQKNAAATQLQTPSTKSRQNYNSSFLYMEIPSELKDKIYPRLLSSRTKNA